jgi:glycosyltransferase involved in cell wall biosynthesis
MSARITTSKGPLSDSERIARRRVAIVALHFAEYAVRLAKALADKCEVLLVLYDQNAVNELGEDWESRWYKAHLNCLVLKKPRWPWDALVNAAQLMKHILRFAPDVIHYQENPRDEVVLTLPFLSMYPKVLTIHDPAPHKGTDANRLRFSRYRWYLPWSRQSADLALVHGEALAAELVRVAPWLHTKVRTVAHGPLGPEEAMPSEEGPPRGMLLLFFGRIHEYKGLEYFVEAVLRLRAEGHPVTGIVAGRGGDLSRHLPRMRSAGCFEVIDRYIAASEVPELFRRARVVVLPYVEGTQSGVAAMAMGYGRPVVASAVGAIPLLVRDRINGLLVPPKDVASLTNAVRSLLLDDVLWNRLAGGAGALRDGELSWRSIADTCELVYAEAQELRHGLTGKLAVRR